MFVWTMRGGAGNDHPIGVHLVVVSVVQEVDDSVSDGVELSKGGELFVLVFCVLFCGLNCALKM